MPRAYIPRHSTRELVRRIRALPGIARVDIIPPSVWQGVKQPARVKVTLVQGASYPDPASTIFTLAEARAWLADEESKMRLYRVTHESGVGRTLYAYSEEDAWSEATRKSYGLVGPVATVEEA